MYVVCHNIIFSQKGFIDLEVREVSQGRDPTMDFYKFIHSFPIQIASQLALL